MNNTLAAAATIAAARRARTPLGPLADDAAPQSEPHGYVVQDAVHELLAADFGRLVGYKIGCTSAVMQQYLGIPHPCSGGVFAKGVHQSGATLNVKDFVRVGVECEIAVRLVRDLSPSEAPFTTDFFAAACVLGTPVARTAAPDLLDVVGRAIVNGSEIGQGTGADVLGHPHHALAWLANHLAAENTGLRAGDIVLTGSLVKTAWLSAGDKVTMELQGLGSAQVAFA